MRLNIKPDHHTVVRLPGRVAMSPVRLSVAGSLPVEFWSTTEASYQQWLVGGGELETWDHPPPAKFQMEKLGVPSGLSWLLVLHNPNRTDLDVHFDVFY